MGANLSMLQLLIELKKLGCNVCVLLPDNGLLCEKLKENNIQFVVSKFWLSLCDTSNLINRFKGFIKTIINILAYVLAYYRIKKRFGKVDIIHSNSTVIHIGDFFNFISGIPHVRHLREFGDLDYCLKYPYGSKLCMLLMNKCTDKNIAISESIINYYSQKGLHNIVLVYNGIPKNRIYERVESDNINILCMGVISPQKNQVQLIDAIIPILNDYKDIKVYFLGPDDSTYADNLKKYVRDNSLDNNIFFEGMQKDLSMYFKTALLGVVPSINEAFGRVTIEFMFNKIPVIASNKGCNLELILNNKTGILYDIENTEDLTKKIIEMITNKELRSRISYEAQSLALNNYTSEINAMNVLSVYKLLV